MDWLYDARTECWSVLTTVEVAQYIKLIQNSYNNRGGLEGQRDVLKTTTAKRIRDRMVSDIKNGAILPPVVFGAVVDEKIFETYPQHKIKDIKDLIPKGNVDEIAIIDGMQRTTAIMEAASEKDDVLKQQIRVEFWLTHSVRPMIYRMLVLNTGQVPWTIARQLAVVFEPLIKEIKKNVPEIDLLIGPDKEGRRVAAAQFKSDTLVELYLAFSLRKSNVDTREALSEEFSRLDFVENLSEITFQDQFYKSLSILSNLDKAFSKYKPEDDKSKNRYTRGRNILDSQPARIGFVTSLAQHVLGRPGSDRDPKDRISRLEAAIRASDKLISRLNKMSSKDVGEFLKLDILRETLDRRSGQVGRFERAVFSEAFKVLIEEDFNINNIESCWRAY
jgi:hypothetical protein